MEMSNSTLERLKGLREEFNISTAAMAEACDVSEAEYLAYETGEKEFSVTFLFKCANHLGVDVFSIVSGDEPHLSALTVTKSGEGMPIKRREGMDYSHIAYLFKDRLAEPVVVTTKYSKTLENSEILMSRHGGQELDYVLSGKLRFKLEDTVTELGPGDSVFYDANKRHGMVAVGGEDCKFLAVLMNGDPKQKGENLEPEFEDTELSPERENDTRVYKKYITENVNEKGKFKGATFNIPENFNFGYDCIRAVAEKSPDKRAMLWVSADGEQKTFSFSDIERYSNKAANLFLSLGIKKGDKVMLVLRRHYQYWFAILGLHKIGAIAIPATDLLTQKEFEYRFNTALVDAVICTGFGASSGEIDKCEADYKDLRVKMMVNAKTLPKGWVDFDEQLEKQSDSLERVETHRDDFMLMYFTSGTTGYPKIVTHTFAYPMGHVVTAKWWHMVEEDGLHFTVSDTSWAKAAWGKLYGQWLLEAGIFVCDFERFNPVMLLPMFKQYGITTFCAPPTVFRFFIKENLANYDFSTVKHTTIAGEALNPEVYSQFLGMTGLKLMEGFGQTETTLLTANLYGTNPKPGSMGKPNPCFDVRLVDLDGNDVAPGETGEVVVRTSEAVPTGLFSGYYRNEQRTKEAWHDGLYHTGDMAWKDEDGFFWFVGRGDDLIKSSGYRIGPFEVESVLMEMPEVLECAVTGVPDLEGSRGQLVKATIVLANGYTASEELKKEIQTYVKEHTAPYKYPRIIEFVESLPKTVSGKIKRVDIRAKDDKAN